MQIIVSNEIEQVCPGFVGAAVEARVVNSQYSPELWQEIHMLEDRFRQGQLTLTGETVAMPTETTVTKIEFPEVEEDVIRIDDAAKEEPVKQEDQVAKEERQKEDKEQRAFAIAAKNKQGCD